MPLIITADTTNEEIREEAQRLVREASEQERIERLLKLERRIEEVHLAFIHAVTD